MKSLKRQVRRKVLMTSLGVTKLVAEADVAVPTTWHGFYNTVKLSSEIFHTRLSTMDRNVERDFRRIEERFGRKLGTRRLYSDEEIEELRDKIEEIEIKQA
jgi:hypothetical protein